MAELQKYRSNKFVQLRRFLNKLQNFALMRSAAYASILMLPTACGVLFYYLTILISAIYFN